MIENKDHVYKPDMTKAYYEIERLENTKELLMKQYSLKYNVPIAQLNEVLVQNGSHLADALLNNIIKSDELIDRIIEINKDIAIWTDYFNKEIEIYLKNGNDTPVIVFLKDHRDLKTKEYLTFEQIADKLHLSLATVKRKYYDYKNSKNEVVKLK